MKDLSRCRLYTFVDTAYLAGRPPARVAAELCEGGSDLIQVRAKGQSRDALLRLVEAIKPVTDRAGAALVVNDDPTVARQAGAALVHLGQEDFFDAGFRSAREVTGAPPALGLGLSTHSPEQAERALAAGPDYIAIGPVHATPTKPGRPPVTLDYVRWAAARVSIPWFAIGGITLENLEEVLAAGATRICVVSAILSAPNVAKACQDFRNRLASAR
jgi:thiamine-phosphate pyrophosphorylase